MLGLTSNQVSKRGIWAQWAMWCMFTETVMSLFWWNSHHWHCELSKSSWRHQMETFSALLVTGEFPSQRPVTRSFDVFLDLCLNKRLSKQSWGWGIEMLPCPLWRHCHVTASSAAHNENFIKMIFPFQCCEYLGVHFIFIWMHYNGVTWALQHLKSNETQLFVEKLKINKSS